MQKTTIIKILFFGFFLISLLLPEKTNAQIVLGTPVLGEPGELGFARACAGDDFNSYFINFVYPESEVTSQTQFILEMSDANGTFSNSDSVEVATVNGNDISPTSPGLGEIPFSIPTTTAGEAYQVRVRSENPEGLSLGSDSFPAYYMLHDIPYTINNSEETGEFCQGGSYILSIDPGSGADDSPINYPSLTYTWFEAINATEGMLIPNETGPTLSVTAEGTYFVKTDYGACTENSLSSSNRVTLSFTTSGTTTAVIESSSGNPFCSQDGATTLSTVQGNTYQWSKNGAVIPNATNPTLQATESGSYSVVVTTGGCQAIGSIDLQAGGFTSSINVPSENEMEQGDILSVIITTNAINPQFQWFLNGALISDATLNSYEATEFGEYLVILTQTSNCISSEQFSFIITEGGGGPPDVDNIPNIISPNGDGINDTWIIPPEYVTGTETEIMIFSSQGEIVFQTNDYQNNWPEDQLEINSVNKLFYYIITTSDQETKKGSITVVK